MSKIILALIAIIVFNVRIIIVKICDTIQKHSNKKELTAQSSTKRRG